MVRSGRYAHAEVHSGKKPDHTKTRVGSKDSSYSTSKGQSRWASDGCLGNEFDEKEEESAGTKVRGE